MRQRIVGLVGRRSRRRLLIAVTATVATAAAGIFAITAIAGHDESFQLDGDVIASTTTSVGGTTQTVDWDSLFNADGSKKTPPTGFSNASVFDRDFEVKANDAFATSDGSTYATGSKDTLPVSGWQCNRDNNVSSKTDIMNSYAAAYSAGGSEFIYFAQERNTNTGDANVGFWFLQDKVGCESTGPAKTFDGAHTDGDLFIVAAYSNGGTVSTIDVYRWNGGANGSLGTTPLAHGVDCEGTLGGDDACATSNKVSDGIGGTITTPWLTANKEDGVGHSLRTSEFFEGTVNLTQSGLGGKCFNSFIGNTRSSTSLTATIFDFSGGTIGECASSTVTTPKLGDGTTNIPAGGAVLPASGTLSVTDSALLTVSGASSWDGTLTFFLCGPTAVSSTTTCTTGGAAVGTRDADINGTYVSPPATITAPGRYCWRAEFSGDASVGVPPSSDSTAGECFLVIQPATTIKTKQSWIPNDTATITAADGSLGTGGTVAFSLHATSDCSDTALFTQNKTITGGAGVASEEVSTTNTVPISISTLYNDAANSVKAYSWKVVYTPAASDTAHTGKQSTCAAEKFAITYTNDNGPGTNLP